MSFEGETLRSYFDRFSGLARSCQIQDAPFANFAFKDLRSLGEKLTILIKRSRNISRGGIFHF